MELQVQEMTMNEKLTMIGLTARHDPHLHFIKTDISKTAWINICLLTILWNN